MHFNTCLERITDLSGWDIRFHILAEGSGGRYWPVSFCDSAEGMLRAWHSDRENMRIPENGDYIHGLLFVNGIDGSVMSVCEADLESLNFGEFMRHLQEKEK